MPGDLRDPTQSVPYHYDPKYDRGANPFEPGATNLENYLQTVVLERGVKLSPERMGDLVHHMIAKGFLHRNPGDESFRNEIFKYLDNIKKAKKIASMWVRGLNQNGRS